MHPKASAPLPTGLRFALLGIKVGLLHLLTSMEVRESPSSIYPVPLDPKVLTLQPKDGIYVDLKPLEAGIDGTIKEEMVKYPSSSSYDQGLVRELEMFYATEESNSELKTSWVLFLNLSANFFGKSRYFKYFIQKVGYVRVWYWNVWCKWRLFL